MAVVYEHALRCNQSQEITTHMPIATMIAAAQIAQTSVSDLTSLAGSASTYQRKMAFRRDYSRPIVHARRQ